MPKILTFALAAAALVLGLTACGGSSSTPSPSSRTEAPPPAASTTPPSNGASGGALTLAADPSGQLKFTKSTLSAKAGKVTVQFTNSSPMPHNLTIEQGTNGPILGATPTFQGGGKTLTVNLKPGTYTFFCSVPDHRSAGMQGTLTVS